MASSRGSYTPTSLLVRNTSLIFVDNGKESNHFIRSCDDLDRINELLTSFHFVRKLDPVQLPSQVVSTGLATPVLAGIEQQFASLELNRGDLVPQSVSPESLRECSGEELSVLLKMAINQGYFSFEVKFLDIIKHKHSN